MQIAEIVVSILEMQYGKFDFAIEKLNGGVFGCVYRFNVDGEKVIKVFQLKDFSREDFYGEVFFLLEANKSGAAVPEVIHYDYIDGYGFIIMEFIEGHKDPGQNIEDYISSLVLSLKLFQKVKLNGVGRFMADSVDKKKFEYKSFYDWLKGERMRWSDIFISHGVPEKVKLTEFITENLVKLVPDSSESVLTHDDFGIRNTIFKDGKTYIFDAGPHRAMPILWDVAAFDYRYFVSEDPYEQKLYQTFYQCYFPHGIVSDEEFTIIAGLRAMIALEKHWGRMGNKTYKNEGFILKTDNCIKAFKELL